ncbi:MAG TPA: hypothetical protein VHR86_02050, partial [Armatimonadota bacterium]|nr:hypothetical protein [Armatimonadota bacterium]
MTLARESFTDAPPLHLRFMDVAAAVECAQPTLREALALLYAPAVETTAAPATYTYHITPEGDIWQGTGCQKTHLAGGEQTGQLTHALLFSTLASRVRSHWLLHAAALSTANGGVLLAGSSGAGKTTLALALAQRGFGWHSDEVAALARNNGCLESFPRMALLRPGTLRLLPQLHGAIQPWPLHEDDAIGCWQPVIIGQPSPLRYVFLL